MPRTDMADRLYALQRENKELKLKNHELLSALQK